jgi:hypothetical protein
VSRWRSRYGSLYLREKMHISFETRSESTDLSCQFLLKLACYSGHAATDTLIGQYSIGRCEGAVVRHHAYGFALRLIATQNRRDRIAERLTFHANRHRLRDDDLRAHERVEHEHQTRCVTPDGGETPCRVIDLSLTGAAIAMDQRPAIGEEVVIGRIQGRVVRHIPQGIAIRFLSVAPSHKIAAERLAGP